MSGVSVLLVDDDDARAQTLSQRLQMLNGVQQIERSRSSSDARAKLSTRQFDLLVLDVALPRFSDGQAQRDEGINLLREIFETDLMQRPTHIIGVTAFEDVQIDSLDRFNQGFARLIHTKPDQDYWIDEICKFANHIAKTRCSLASKVDVVIVAALWDPEFMAVLDSGLGFQEGLPLTDSTRVWFGSIGGMSVAAVCALRMGPVSAAILTTTIINSLHPRMIAMTGICAGVRGEVELGDVVISTDVLIWDSGKLVDGGELSPAPVSYPTQERLISALRGGGLDQAVAQHWDAAGSDRPTGKPKIHFGPMASGSSVIADADVVDRIRKQNRKVIAIDMEAYAVYAACAASPHPQPCAVTIKSVCDFADAMKNSSVQRFCSGASVRVIQAAIEVAKQAGI